MTGDTQHIETHQPSNGNVGWWIAGGSAAALATAIGVGVAMHPDKFLTQEYIERVGFPAAITLFVLSMLGWGLYSFVAWLRPQADAFFARHLKLVDTTTERVVEIAKHSENISTLQQQLAHDNNRNADANVRNAEANERAMATLERLEERMASSGRQT